MSTRVGGSAETVTTVNDIASIDDVVRRAQQGDVDAFEAIYRTHSVAIVALCRRMAAGGDDREVRELVQDVFVRAWERLTTFRGQSSLTTWLHRLAVNVVLERFRSSKRDAARLIDADEMTFGSPSPAAQLDAAIDLDSALVQLPGGARTVFVLHDIEGYSHDEISQMTGIAPGTARAQLWRARRALMRLLDL
jgi:RNA polymerase sigma-70 factor (ECF subfamily)